MIEHLVSSSLSGDHQGCAAPGFAQQLLIRVLPIECVGELSAARFSCWQMPC